MPTNKEGYIKDYYRRWRQSIIEALGGNCAICGGNGGKLEIHHEDDKVRGMGRGRIDRLTEWKEQLKEGEEHNLVPLCKGCHNKVDSAGSNEDVPEKYWEEHGNVCFDEAKNIFETKGDVGG